MAADRTRLPQGIDIGGSLLVARPVDTIVEDSGSLYISTDAVNAAYTPVGASGGAPVFASGQFTCAAQSTNVTITGILVTDMFIAVVDTDDTGTPLGGIQVCRAAGSNVGVVITINAPSVNVDGVIKWVVLRFTS